MNYIKIYDTIILNAKLLNRTKLNKNNCNYIYFENHHIIPRCLNGSNDKENLVLLTAREHFICHKLLTFIYPKNRKLASALHKLIYGNTNKCIKTSRDYEYIKNLISNLGLSSETKEKIRISNTGRMHTQESKNKMSKSLKGKSAPNKGISMSNEQKIKLSIIHSGMKMNGHIVSEETRKKMSNSAKNKIVSDETRKKMSESRMGKLNPMAGKTGENNPNFGRKHSDEAKKKVSISNTGKIRTSEQIEKYRLINKGRKHSIETKEKIRAAIIKRQKED